jgi:hypothetical protein
VGEREEYFMIALKNQAYLDRKPSASNDKSIATNATNSERVVQQEMAEYRRELIRNPKAAHDFLVSAGIITAKGNLRKVFGG